MDCTTIFLILSIVTFIYVFITGGRKSGGSGRLPPGPTPLPIVGNIFKLGKKPHHSFAALSKTYGPLMSLKLGAITAIVISSPEIAKQFFQKHDQSFSARLVPDAGRALDHHLFSIVWLPVSDQWRKLRRISKEHLFSVQQLDAGQIQRHKKVQELVNHLNQCCIENKPVNICSTLFTTSLNVLSNFIFSMDMARYDSVETLEFMDAVSNLSKLFGNPNLSDFFPILQPFDLQGFRRKGNIYTGKLITVLDRIVTQRVESRANSSSSSMKGDVLDLLLDLSEKDGSELSLTDIVHLLMDLFGAGTETTSHTLEWAMSELINNPEKMVQARLEFKEIIANENKVFEESDISKLPYIQAIVKETLRLHPPVPFLLPHKALCDVEFQGFMVHKDTQIICNIWTMGRDSMIWPDPEKFMPERFLNSKIEYKGRDFELIPFGAGRRICPGLSLAHRMLHLVLGSLIYTFDWKLQADEDMNMNELFGITLHKETPLMVIPTKL